MPRSLSLFEHIHFLRERYYQQAHAKEALLKLLLEAEIPEQVYNSNAIENSTLTLDETERILLSIDLDRYISEREVFEAKNLARVVAYIHTHATTEELSFEKILFLHRVLLANIRDDIAGRFREKNEYVRVGSHIAPPPAMVLPALESMFAEYHGMHHHHIIKRIARLHLSFEHIHPFVDGNGRLGRVINNYLLVREGFVPINITFVERKQYYEALRAFDQHGTTDLMEGIIGRALTQSYHKRLAYMDGKTILPLSKYAKQYGFSYSNLLNKAKRQTIDAFLEKGVWKIGLEIGNREPD